jgi:CBS domain-containing protein
MTTDVVSVLPTSPLKTAARLMVEHGYRMVPVVDAHRHVLGVVSERDLLLKQRDGVTTSHGLFHRLLRPGSRTKSRPAEATTAGEVMTSPAVTVSVHDRVDRVAGMMLDNRRGSLPVVDQGRLVGIVTRSDLLRLFLESDEALTETVRNDILRRTLLLPPDQFDVRVVFGVVKIRGHVARRALAQLVVDAVSHHAGVIGVQAEITWETHRRNRHLRGVVT